MKRWLLGGLLGLAVIIFLAPGIVGLLAERSLEKQLELNRSLGPDLAVRQLKFERGFFTSAGRHRVPLSDERFAELITALTPGADAHRDAPALIIETQLEHGPFSPFAATLEPGLAHGISTLSLELADGNELPVPGVLYSRIGLTGHTTLRYELPPGDETRGERRVHWQSMDVAFGSSADGSELSLQADLIEPAIEQEGWQGNAAAEVHVVANSSATPWGFAVGDVSAQISGGSMTTGDSTQRFSILDLNASASTSNDAVSADLRFALLGFDTDEGPYDIEVTASAGSLQAEILGRILRAVQYTFANGSGTSDEFYFGFDADLRRLLSAGASFNLKDLQLRTPLGDALARLSLSVPEQDSEKTWAGLLLALEANTAIELARTLVEAPSPLTDQLRILVAGGFLVLDSDVYRLQGELQNGKATINGAPLVIPMDIFNQ